MVCSEPGESASHPSAAFRRADTSTNRGQKVRIRGIAIKLEFNDGRCIDKFEW